MNIFILTIFPHLITSYTNESILKRAQEKDLINIYAIDIRDFADNKHNTVDDKSYGGGPGMVLQAQPILRAVEFIQKEYSIDINDSKTKIITTSPRGQQFNQSFAKQYSTEVENIIIICGRYEGIDARVMQALNPIEVTVGPYVLTGGELPALIMIDAIARHIPNVLGHAESTEESRAASGEMYTRPASFEWSGSEYSVPEIMLSGHHANIEAWRAQKNNDNPIQAQ